ncbi:MAG: porin [Rhizobacter sp.]
MTRSNLAWASAATCLACAAPLAHAADTVKIYGGMDGNVTRVSAEGRGSVWQVRDGGMYVSKLGFTGMEDLGDGFKAEFVLESQANSDTGTGVATNTNNYFSGTPSGTSGLNWNRKATVGLHTPFGELRFGRDYTSTFVPATYFDPFFSAGIASAVNYQPYYKYVFSPLAPTTVNFLLAPGTLVRASNMVAYYIPSTWVPGFYAYVQGALGEGVGPRYTGFGTGFYRGPYFVAAAYGVTRNPLGDATGYLTPDTASGSNKLKVWSLGGSYKFFGSFSLMGFYHSQSFDAYGESLTGLPVFTERDRKVDDALVGFSWAIGPHTIKSSLMLRDDKGVANADSRQFGLGYSYHLSKRTAVYANAVSIRNDNSANYNFISAGVNPVNGGSARAFQAGLSHNF